MRFLTFQTETVLLWLLRPNWDKPIALTLGNDGALTDGLTGDEGRRAFGESINYKQEYKGVKWPGQGIEYDTAMNRLKDESVVMPLWMDVNQATGNSGGVITVDTYFRFRASVFALWDDDGRCELVAVDRDAQTANTITLTGGTILTWTSGFYVAPVLFGKFDPRPARSSENDEVGEIDVKFVENSVYNRRVEPISSGGPGAAGADTIGFTSTPFFNIRPNWTSNTDDSVLRIMYEKIGLLRQQERAFYDQSPKRGLTLDFLGQTRLEATTLMAFFQQMRGPIETFMLPTYRGDLRLKSPIAFGSDAIICERTPWLEEYLASDHHPGTPYLCVITPDAFYPFKAQAAEAPDGNTMVVHKASQWPLNLAVDAAIVSAMMLVRFANTELVLTFQNDEVWQAQISFLECTEEYTGPAGAQPTMAQYFKFELTGPNAPVWRYTNYERDLEGPDGNYVSGPFENGQRRNSTALDSEDLEIKSFKFDGNPLLLYIPYGLETPLKVTIYECPDINFPDEADIVFTGEIGEVQPNGQELTARAYALGTQADMKFPNFLIQKNCNYFLYHQKTCKVDKAAFRLAGTIVGENDAAFTVTIDIGGGQPDDYFALGWITAGDGATYEVRGIMRSASVGSSVLLTINRAFTYNTIGDTVTFQPGCDRQAITCDTKFNNLINNGGHPNVPLINPTIEAVPINNDQGRSK